MRVIFYMSRPVLTTTPDTDFHVAFDLMRARRIHHVPVMEGDQIVGIAAERDLLLAAANFGSAEVPVSMVMRKPVICVSDRAHLKQAARLLVENRIGSLPVVNARKQLVGIITQTDIFKITAGMLHARKDVQLPSKKASAKAAPAAGKPVKAAKAATAATAPQAAKGAKTAKPAKPAKAPAATNAVKPVKVSKASPAAVPAKAAKPAKATKPTTAAKAAKPAKAAKAR